MVRTAHDHMITFPTPCFQDRASLVFLHRPFFFDIFQYLDTHTNIKDDKYLYFYFCMFMLKTVRACIGNRL